MWQALAKIANRIVITAILVMGVVMILARLLTPLAAEYHDEIEATLAKAVGRKVTVQKISARWKGFGPLLVLRDVALETKKGGASPIRLSEIRVGFSVIDSIVSGTPVPDMVALVKASIRLRKLENGTIKLLGINDFDLSDSSEGVDIVQLPLAVGLIDSEITLDIPGFVDPLRLYNLNLRLKQEDDHYGIEAKLQIGGDTANRLEASANIYGDPTETTGLNSDFHLSGKAMALQALTKYLLPPDFKQVSGLADFELWGKLRQGELMGLEGDISLGGVAIERVLPSRISSYNINQLFGKFRWQRKKGSWRLELVDLQLKRHETLWPKSAVTIQTGLDEGKRPSLELSASFLRLQDLLSAVTLLPPAKRGPMMALQKLQPAGDLRDLKFTFKDDPVDPHWHLTGVAERLRISAWNAFPGINGLSLSFTANQEGGAAIFNSKEVVLSFAEREKKRKKTIKKEKSSRLFRNSIRLKRVVGPISWNKKDDGWRVDSPSITVDTPDFDTRTRFALQLPENSSPQLDLQTNLDHGDITYIRDYLPVGVMNNEVIRWLDQALVSGRVQSGTLLIRGSLDDFPFDEKATGRLEALLGIEDAILNYNIGWPRLERMKGELLFLNNSFSAKIFDAEVYASRITRAEARIDRLDPVTPLKLDCEIVGPLADYFRVLTDTPLSKRFGPRASQLNSKEEAGLNFSLDQPLDDDDPSEAEIIGFVEFRNNTLEMEDKVQLYGLNGKMHFDRHKVWAKGIEAESLGSKLKLDIVSPKKGPKRTEVHARGRYKVKTLLDRYVNIPLKHIKGATNWHLKIDIPHSSRGPNLPTKLDITSKLRGVAIDMPPPFGKKAGEAKQLHISLNAAEPDKPLPIHARLGDIADGYLLMTKSIQDKRNLERAEIRLGGAKAKRPNSPGLHVNGTLPFFKLDPWIEMFKAGGRKDAPPLDLKVVNVDFGRFELGHLAFDNILIEGGPTASGWSGQVDSPQIKGHIELPKDTKKGRIRLDLDHYSVTTDTSNEKKFSSINKFDPRGLPPLEVTSKILLFNGVNLGAADLQISKQKRGIHFDRVEVKSDWFKFKGKGTWLMNKTIPDSAISFKMETSDLGKLMEGLGFTPNIKRAPGHFEGDLQWPGSPANIKNLWLTGHIDLKLRKGMFVDIDPGAGRIFGLLNLGALHRRLVLDFSDFFGKGLSFDKIEGSFTLDNGNAYTQNLSIEGSTGIIEISGRTGLVSRDFDQLVTVTPDVTGTLFTGVALATATSGPVGLAALYLTNKVVGKKINPVKTQYQVVGPWDKPEIISNKKTRQTSQQRPKGFDLDYEY